MPRFAPLLLLAFTVAGASAVRAADDPKPTADGPVKLERGDGVLKATIESEPFALFVYKGYQKPFLDELTAPGGVRVTRALGDTEVKDHPHHKGLWVGLEEVNGLNHWAEAHAVVPLVVEILDAAGDPAVFQVTSEWQDADGRAVLKETTTVRLFADRLVSYDVVLTPAGDEAVHFGDTKEGFFALRMANELREQGGDGKILSSEGQTGEAETWGRTAAWIDYSGTVDGKPVGVAVFDHPGNFRPGRYHVRGYGLFAVSPFGESAYTKGERPAAPVTLQPGESLRLRYAAFVHAGDAQAADVAGEYKKYAEGTPARGTSE